MSVGANLTNFARSIASDWMLILVYFTRRLDYVDEWKNSTIGDNDNTTDSTSHWFWNNPFSDAVHPYVRHFYLSWMFVTIEAYILFFGIGCSLHWYYYVHQRHKAEEWKIQPNKWLPRSLEKQEIIEGVTSLLCTNITTALIATYLINDGPSMVYYDIDKYSKLWLFLQGPVLFLYLEYLIYWFHRLYHTSIMYKLFHKSHHAYKHPTAWSVTAIHPVEILHLQMCLVSPLFMMPIHLMVFFLVIAYNFTHAIFAHSGINFKAKWWQPWQPDVSFHDSHHQHTHVNFGFNMFLWDKLHGTYRAHGGENTIRKKQDKN